jgi:hypothetical protein
MASEDDKPVTLGDLKKMQAGNSSAPAAATKTTDPGIIDKATTAFGKAAEAVTPLYFGFQKLTTGAETAGTAVNAMAAGVSAIGLPGLAGMSKDLAGAFLAQKTNMDKASAELGIGANNIGKFVRMSGEAGLTTEQFTETVKKTDGLMSGLAGSSQRGAEAFSKVQKSLIESNAGEALNAIGISGKELADMTALSMSNNTKLNLKTAAGQAEAAAAAGKLAFELDATSKITGQSREALAATLKAEEQKPNVILMEMQMTKEQLAGYKNLKEQMVGFGPSFQSLSAEIASGGVRTKEGLAQMAALGPAGIEFEKATKMMTNAKTDEEKKNAQAALDRAQAAINQRMASKEYNDMMQYGTAEQKAAISAQVSGYKGLQGAAKAAQEAGGDYVAGRRAQQAEAAAMQKGQKVDENGKPVVGADGKAVADEGAKSAQMLNAVNRQATIQAGGMARAMETANAALGKSPAAINAFNTALGFVGKSKTMKEAEAGVYAAPGAVANAAGVGGEAPTAAKEGGSGGTGGRKPTKVPVHGEGGVIQGPELAVIAEKGPEAVIPIDKLKDMIGNVSATVSSASGGAGINQTQMQAHMDKMMAKASEMPSLMKDMSKALPGGAGDLGGMFSPKIINQQAADAQKALNKSAPKTTEAAPKNTEEAKKKEAEDKAKAAEDAKKKEQAASPAKPAASAGDATMKDLKDQLVTLNKNMLQLINHSEATADAAHKTAKSTAKATGAR